MNKCCCLFCDETSNTAQYTNSWRQLFTHIAAWAFQVIKLSNTTPRYLKVVSQDMDFPRRLRFKMQSRSLCLWDVNSTHLVFETWRTNHSDKHCNANSMSAYLTSRTLVNCLMLSKELSLNTYSHTSSVAYHRSSACPFKNKNTLSSKQSNKWMGLSGYARLSLSNF